MKKCILFLFCLNSGIQAEYCAFCDAKVLKAQVFYEGDLVLALCTHKPVVPGHSLIIPKRHVERFDNLSDEEMLEIGHVIKKINAVYATSYLLLQKNGKEVGQSVPHAHFHYMPRKEGDDSKIAFMIKMLIADLKKPIQSDEMEAAVQKMKTDIMN